MFLPVNELRFAHYGPSADQRNRSSAIFIPAQDKRSVREVDPKNGTDFQLSELYALLGCTSIETLSLDERNIMVLDEEGKLTGKPRKERATRIAGFVSPKEMVIKLLRRRMEGPYTIWAGEPITDMTTEVDYIAGDVLVCAIQQLR